MKCAEVLPEIIPFLEGELGEEKAKEYKRHTTVCRKCAATAFRIKKAKSYIENELGKTGRKYE